MIPHSCAINTHFYKKHHSKWCVCVKERKREKMGGREAGKGRMHEAEADKKESFIHHSPGVGEEPTHL